jgi:sulfate adenylyltransferase subunit 2
VGTSPGTSTAEITELNARRRRAVQLRVDGRTLAQIRQETGLSVPTIIDAYQAFTGGGWSAIDVGSRGRPKGEGRVLPLTQEQGLRDAALQSLPEDHGFGRGLWSAALLSQLSQRRTGVALAPRALSRLLERWGLGLQPLREAASRSADAAWVEEHWVPELARSRGDKSQVSGPTPIAQPRAAWWWPSAPAAPCAGCP